MRKQPAVIAVTTQLIGKNKLMKVPRHNPILHLIKIDNHINISNMNDNEQDVKKNIMILIAMADNF